MSGPLINLYMCPGVRPVRVDETLRQMLAKCVLAVTGEEAKGACRTEQPCGGLEAGIEGGVHAVRILWKNHTQ